MEPTSLTSLCFLGNPSAWLQSVLDAAHRQGVPKVQIEPDVEGFLKQKGLRRAFVVIVEGAASQLLEQLRQIHQPMVLVWVSRSFTKEEVASAVRHRVSAVVENPLPGDETLLGKLRLALGQAETFERSESLLRSLKSALIEQSGNPLFAELRTGISKLEHHLQNELVGARNGTTGETRLPFYKGQALTDALLTVQDLERTGTLWIKAKLGMQGKVDFLQGTPVTAVCGETRSLKAIYRMYLWDDVEYAFQRCSPSELSVEEKFPLSLKAICSEGEAFAARYLKIRNQIPPGQLRLQLQSGALTTQTALERFHFSVLSSVVELGKVSQVIDYNPLPDVVLYETLIDLKKAGVITVAR